MVLADRGVVCIDEFDKMSDMDRVAIHEVMEQQTVTIAKAGIHASLNARCSVVAAANPIYGNYDHSLTPTKNIGLPDSLLSRFDLLFIVLDHMDSDIDRQISEHVLRMHRYRRRGDEDGLPSSDGPERKFEDDDDGEEETSIYVKYDRLLHGEKRKRRGVGARKELLTTKFLKKFIHYAKGRTPKLSDAASDKIATAYADMRAAGMAPDRKQETGGTLPITARSLETIIRLSSAHAKLKLHKEIIEEDVDAALELMEFAIYHRELKDMDARNQEEEDAARRRATEEREGGTRGGGGDDGDNGGGGDGPSRPRQTGSVDGGAEPADGRPSQRATRAGTTPQRGAEATGGANGHANGTNGHTNGHVDGEDDIEEEEDGAHFTRRQRQRTSQDGAGTSAAHQSEAQATLAAMAADEPEPTISPERSRMFQTAISAHLRATREDKVTVADALTAANRGNSRPFSVAEVNVIFLQMEAENRVMFSGGVAHVI
eukprot:TRINITY_DN29612_c0_g1_i1.p1 TRINITY_DN29612_c0_g1~~TRINITY_DN29612_c0_g1_i1.p1  ORF type:complete len:500 (+),score=137.57 TRINITY_DN29612_c0_g1_i1:42-1502(+)